MKWTGAPLGLDLFQESLGWHTGRQEGIMGGGEGDVSFFTTRKSCQESETGECVC